MGNGRAASHYGSRARWRPHVRAFDLATDKVVANFFAYDSTFRGGSFVSRPTSRVRGKPTIATGPDVGGGPHVRVFDPMTGEAVANFMAADPRSGTAHGSDGPDRGGRTMT